ncbi:MAG: hypothetical protein HRU69_05250 [Flammeovirgaceae bacterium]|nr:MAG: hypothetical protein HRU69_05250 [Flammeovirgaceae bacterium]
MAVSKKRLIKSLETLSDDLKELLKKQYPNGYESSITRISNAKKEPIFVFPLETEDATYLVKIPITKNSEGEYEMEPTGPQEFDNSGDDDDDFSSDDEFSTGEEADSFDDEGSSRKSGREASYDPDFDN